MAVAGYGSMTAINTVVVSENSTAALSVQNLVSRKEMELLVGVLAGPTTAERTHALVIRETSLPVFRPVRTRLGAVVAGVTGVTSVTGSTRSATAAAAASTTTGLVLLVVWPMASMERRVRRGNELVGRSAEYLVCRRLHKMLVRNHAL